MVVVFYAHSAIVQGSGNFKHLEVLTGELMKHAELFEELDAEVYNVLYMALVAVVPLNESGKLISEDVGNRLFNS